MQTHQWSMFTNVPPAPAHLQQGRQTLNEQSGSYLAPAQTVTRGTMMNIKSQNPLGARELSTEECMCFGVPVGSTWKPKSEKQLKTESREEVVPAPSPVMYGGYMPTQMRVNDSTPRFDDESTWQA